MKDNRNDLRPHVPAIGRRDLMKIGAGVVMGTMGGPHVFAQEESGRRRDAAVRPANVTLAWAGPGFKYTANRLSGNGPMDETSRRVVMFVRSFSEAKLTEASIAGLNKLMIDAVTAWVGSFGSEIAQICARMAKWSTPNELKSTVAGYGFQATPEAAALANCFMVRQADYNDGDPPRGGHASVVIPGVLAIAEAVHATGPQTLAAVAIAYEFLRAARRTRSASRVGWGDAAECSATAMGCGKLLGLNDDRLANALSLALVSYLSLGKGDGTQSHFKTGHSANAIRNGVFSALAAREGMTGPNEPFEGLEGLFDTVTGPIDLRLPAVEGELAVDNFRVKRYPAEGNAQAMLHQAIPPIREWAKVEDIASVHIECSFGTLKEIASPECWDPSNRETADHSLPYMVAAALMDGEVYLDSFTPQRYLHDAKLKEVMGKITCSANPEFESPQGRSKLTVRKKTGDVMTKEVLQEIPLTYEEVLAKFDRVCKYMSVPSDQRDRARAAWTNLRAVKDVAVPMAELGHFGPVWPLTGGTPKS